MPGQICVQPGTPQCKGYQPSRDLRYGGSHIASSGAESTLHLTFTVTGIKWIGVADSCTGQATVDLDGVSQMVDAYRASSG